MKKPRHFILPLLLLICTLFYYFGELADWVAWEALRLNFFYGIHDVHRLLFLAPIIYAGHFGKIKGAVIVTLVSFMVFLPRAFFISPYPDPLLRMGLFTVIAGTIGCLVGALREKSEQRARLEKQLRDERDKYLGILERLPDGVIITGPDYKVRWMNSSLRSDFGEGASSYCYRYLHNLDGPCQPNCRLPDVVNGETARWVYTFPDGRTYEVLALPYRDADGVTCQLATFHMIAHHRQAEAEPT